MSFIILWRFIRRLTHRENEGIVTKFTMSSISSTFWSEVRVFHPAENDNLLEALARFSENVERDPEGSLLFHSAPEATLLILFHTGEQQNRLAVFDSFEGISPLSHMIKPKEYSFSQIMTGLEDSVTMDPTKYRNNDPPNLFFLIKTLT